MLHLLVLLVLSAVPPDVPAVGGSLPLPAGTPLRQLASPVAPTVAVVPTASAGEVVELHGAWVRVRWHGITGWLLPDAATDRAAAEPSAHAGPEPAPPALGEARRWLGPALRAGHLGPFDLLTDVDDAALLDRLDAVARGLPALFAERYGLRTDGGEDPATAGWTVVLFADAGDYRAFADHVARATGRDPAELDYVGHAVGRLAVLSVAERPERLLLHETGHLMLRRTLGHEPPVWLDEGIAGDLEMMTVDSAGRLLPARLDRAALPRRRLRQRTGPLARLDELAEAARRHRLPPVGPLLAVERRELATSPRRPALYALTALFVRYLLEGAGGDVAERFRGYLAAGAGGDLPSALEMEPTELDHGFAGWLTDVEARLAARR